MTFPISNVSSNTANTSNISNTEVSVANVYCGNANVMSVGSTFRTTLIADKLYGHHATLNLRMGPNGNVSDPVVFTVSTQGQKNLTKEFITVVTALGNGNTGNSLAGVVKTGVLGDLKINNNPAQYIPTQTATCNTQANNYLSVSYVEWLGAGNSVFDIAVIQQLA